MQSKRSNCRVTYAFANQYTRVNKKVCTLLHVLPVQSVHDTDKGDNRNDRPKLRGPTVPSARAGIEPVVERDREQDTPEENNEHDVEHHVYSSSVSWH